MNRRRISLFIRGALASLLFVAGALQIGLDVGFVFAPKPGSSFAANSLAGAQLLIAVLLAHTPTVRWASWMAAVMFSGFAVFVGWTLSPINSACGCPTTTEFESLGTEHLLVNLACLAASLSLILRYRGRIKMANKTRGTQFS